MGQDAMQWNAKLYDQSHSFVSKLGAGVIELLAPNEGEKILDLGCGTGDLAQQIYLQGARVIEVDQSEVMIRTAKDKYPHITFLVKDATNLPFNQEFDAVFSNATLHWIKVAKQALANIYKSLKPGGRFVAEFGGKGNVEQITNALGNQFYQIGLEFSDDRFPWYFPSIGEYTSLMEEVGFTVTFAQHFERPTPLEGQDGLRNFLEMFGNAFFIGIPAEQKEQIIKGTENELKSTLFLNGQWVADYWRIRVIGIKK